MTCKNLLSQFAHTSALVVGDIMLDEFIWGEVRRISPEAPVPIVEAKRRSYAPGGAGNVAANVVSLGGSAYLGGLAGEDDSARQLRRVLEECGTLPTGLILDPLRPTTTKTRVIAHSQQMVRVDSEARSPLSSEAREALLAWMEETIERAGACVLSDYSKGVITPDFAQGAIERAKRAGKPVIVDPKGAEYAKYRGATLITPNLHELEVAVGREVQSDSEMVAAVQILANILPGTALLITRGAQGMSLFQEGREGVHIPTVARNVYDVTGAGDTVVGTLALALGAGAELETAARLANRAAGIVVGKVGTARASYAELLEGLD